MRTFLFLTSLIFSISAFAANPPIIWGSPYAKLLTKGIQTSGSDTTTTCVTALAGSIRYNAGTFEGCDGSSWASLGGGGGSGVTTAAALGSSANANGMTISGANINLEPASASFGGYVSTGTQTIAGAKTFTGAASFTAATHTQTLSQDGATVSYINNAGTGVLSRSFMSIGEDQSTKFMGFGYANNSYTDTGIELIGKNLGWVFTNSGALGLSLVAGKSTGFISFGTGGFATANQRMLISSAGAVKLNAYTTAGVITNDTSGNLTSSVPSAIGASPNANGMTLGASTLVLQPASASFGGVVTTGTQTLAGDKTLTGTTAVTLTGTGNTSPLSVLIPSLANDNYNCFLLGKAASNNNAVTWCFYPNATAAASYSSTGVYGQNTLYLTGNDRVGINNVAPTTDLDVTGTVLVSTSSTSGVSGETITMSGSSGANVGLTTTNASQTLGANGINVTLSGTAGDRKGISVTNAGTGTGSYAGYFRSSGTTGVHSAIVATTDTTGAGGVIYSENTSSSATGRNYYAQHVGTGGSGYYASMSNTGFTGAMFEGTTNSTNAAVNGLKLSLTGTSGANVAAVITNASTTDSAYGITSTMSGTTGQKAAGAFYNASANFGSAVYANMSSSSSTGYPFWGLQSATAATVPVFFGQGSATGVRDIFMAQNTVAAANNSGASLVFQANRTTGGQTTVASIGGLITDITNGAYKGALVGYTASNAAPTEVFRFNDVGALKMAAYTTKGTLVNDTSGNVTTRAPWYVAAKITGANVDIGNTTHAYAEVVNGGLTMTPKSGSAAVGTVCSTTSSATTPTTSATTCAAGSEGLGGSFAVPEAGNFEVCFQSGTWQTMDSTEVFQNTMKLVETPVNAQTITQEGGPEIGWAGVAPTSVSITTTGTVSNICGLFDWTAKTAGDIVAVRLFLQVDAPSGTLNANVFSCDTGISRTCYFTAKRAP